jgi:hypothetical protein
MEHQGSIGQICEVNWQGSSYLQARYCRQLAKELAPAFCEEAFEHVTTEGIVGPENS